MRRILSSFGVEAVLLIALAALGLSGLVSIPFHPDESSLLYQSRDLELVFSDPLDMAWRPDLEPSVEATYRLLNGPLPKYVLGLGRRAAGYGPEAVSVDWDWSQSWEENERAGALPRSSLLLGARAASTIALLAAAVALYAAGRRLGGRAVGLASAALLGVNALALLHGRRAMSEGTLLLGASVAFVGMLSADRRPRWAGVTMALAATAKASTMALLPVALLAAAWPSDGSRPPLTALARRVLWLSASFLAVFFLLQPVTWRHPIQSLQAMWSARQELLERQVVDIRRMAPDHIVPGYPQRLAVLAGNLYVAPLQFAEVGNYLVETAASVDEYQADPLRNLLRGSIGGGILLAVTLLGVIRGWRRSRTAGPSARRGLMLLVAATVLQAAALVVAVPLPIQRYALPLLPLLCLWQGLGLTGGPRPAIRSRGFTPHPTLSPPGRG